MGSQRPTDRDAELAASLVHDAGQLARGMRLEGLAAEQKTSISDLVTEADHAAEELVRRRLREECPEDGIVGEEGEDVPGRSGRTWVIDPVDGTWNFVHGISHWCSALALRDDATGVLVGAVHDPEEQVTWVGGPDLPTTRDGVPLPAPADAPAGEVGVGTYLHTTYYSTVDVVEPWQRAATRASTIRMLGSGSMDLVAVAEGRLGCWFQHTVPPWDWLPGQGLVLGAGGTTEQVEVRGYTWSVAGRPTAVAELAAALREA